VIEQRLSGLLLFENAIKWDKPSAVEPDERAALLADWTNRDACFGMLNWYRAAV
jgi:hypothetical protein